MVNDDKGKAIKDADIALNNTNKGVTNTRGQLDLGELTEGSYQVTATKNGYETVTSTELVNTNTSTVAQITLGAFQLTKVEPSDGSEASPQKWFVNLNASAAKKQGRELDIIAHITPKMSGMAINFKLEAGSSNVDQATLAADDKAALTENSNVTDANGVAKTKLSLSRCGMDKFRVIASIDGIDGVTNHARCSRVDRVH